MPEANPLLEPWSGPFEAPPFDRIEPRCFGPAFDAALKDARAEIDAVAADPEPPTFANTIEAMERSGRALDRVARVFFTLAGADTNDEIEAIERDIAPELARHRSDTYLNEALFRRVDTLKAKAEGLGLGAEQARVLDRYHLDFVRAGAGAPPEAKARLAEIGERLATLAAEFGQNVLADEKAWTLWLDAGDLDGLPDFAVASAARLADERGQPTAMLKNAEMMSWKASAEMPGVMAMLTLRLLRTSSASDFMPCQMRLSSSSWCCGRPSSEKSILISAKGSGRAGKRNGLSPDWLSPARR